MLVTILSIAGGIVSGMIIALKVIAPRTASTLDDRLLALLELVKPHLPAPVLAQAVTMVAGDGVPRAPVVDHRSPR